jgi:hypothetical protein
VPKLTLNADSQTIVTAKQLAAERGISVSAMFSQFVEALAGGRRSAAGELADLDQEIGPITRRATGLVKLPPGKTVRQLLAEIRTERAEH